MRKNLGARHAGVIAAGIMFGTVGSADAAADLSGKMITWTVPFPPGGGSGVIAEFVAPFLTKYLPGHPAVKLVYDSGNGSIKGANQFAERARSNGLSLLITTASTQLPYLLGDPRVHYDYKDWRILMALSTGGVVFTTSSLGVTRNNLPSLVDRQLVFGNLGATSLDLAPLLGFKLLGLNVQHVFGYKGRADTLHAFLRGDLNIDYQTTAAYLETVQPLVDKGMVQPLFSWGVLDPTGHLVRDPTFPDLPDFAEVYEQLKGTAPSGAEFDTYFSIFAAGFPAQKMIVVPKDTPDDMVAAYQSAIVAMKADPDYRARARKILGDYTVAAGLAAQVLYKESMSLPTDGSQRISAMLASEYGIKLGD